VRPDTCLVLTVPMPLNLANSRMHWRKRHREKCAYWDTLDMMRVLKHIPGPPRKPYAKARISSRMVLGAAMDQDNAMSRHKWVCDWLSERGYIADDRAKCLTWTGFPEQHVTRKEPASITITLEAA
jgi:hypothetical protein